MRALLLSWVLFAACAAHSNAAPKELRIHKDAGVKDCESLGVIEERIESPTESDELAVTVRKAVLHRAKKLRATDLVIYVDESDSSYAHMKAEAFHCKAH